MQIGPTNSMMPAPMDPTPNTKTDSTQVKQVASAVRALNQSQMYGEDRELQFARDPSTKAWVIKVVQHGTGEVVEQIPPEEILRAAAALQQMVKGNTGK